MGISLSQVNKCFPMGKETFTALEDISLHVESGEAVALLGPSGCGKSTILKMIAGMLEPSSGTVEVTETVGMMMQDDMLLPWRTVLENACLPLEVRDKQLLPEGKAKAQSLLPRFGLSGFGDSLPEQLSGGMRQRAALLRTVMGGGSCWLLDEPFARLDALTKEELQLWLKELRQSYRPAMLLVTHDVEEAITLCDRIYLMGTRPGRIIGELPVEGEGHLLKQKIRELLRRTE